MVAAKNTALALLLGTVLWPQIPGEGHEWSYSGAEGPTHWGDISPEYSACKNGHQQSPIDIRGAEKDKPQPIDFKYAPSPLKIVNNGHTIEINYAPGSHIAINGKEYQVVQFHFHHPSEEEIQGRRYDMVMHIVHKDAGGHLAVVAVLMKSGKENAFLKSIWAHMAARKGEEQSIDGVNVNVADLLPAAKGYYTFAGSLTTPPCSEGVRWFVLESPVEVSPDQIAAFARLDPLNERPIQPSYGRKIEEHP
jgi:carbonic anhydrase